MGLKVTVALQLRREVLPLSQEEIEKGGGKDEGRLPEGVGILLWILKR